MILNDRVLCLPRVYLEQNNDHKLLNKVACVLTFVVSLSNTLYSHHATRGDCGDSHLLENTHNSGNSHSLHNKTPIPLRSVTF